MKIIAFAPLLLETLQFEAAKGYPQEICGILIGRDEQGPGGQWRLVERIEQVGNAAAQSANRFEIDPRELLKWERVAVAEGKVILGFYHSHPDHPAIPSATDREKAWPIYSYAIASVNQGQCAEVRSWVLADEKGEFTEQAVVDMTAVDEQSD